MKTRKDGDVLIVQLDDGRANAIGGAWVATFEANLNLAADCTGLVITGTGRIFSAGLDIPEVHGLDRPGLAAFINHFDDLIARLMSLPVPTVAAINGHAVAGGLILAMACDTRIAAPGDYRLSLNSLDLGIPLPMAALEAVRRSVPSRELLPLVVEGASYSPEDALERGLAQKVTGNLVQETMETIRHLGRSPLAYASMKRRLVAPHLERIAKDREATNAEFVEAWFSAEATALREKAVAQLEEENNA